MTNTVLEQQSMEIGNGGKVIAERVVVDQLEKAEVDYEAWVVRVHDADGTVISSTCRCQCSPESGVHCDIGKICERGEFIKCVSTGSGCDIVCR